MYFWKSCVHPKFIKYKCPPTHYILVLQYASFPLFLPQFKYPPLPNHPNENLKSYWHYLSIFCQCAIASWFLLLLLLSCTWVMAPGSEIGSMTSEDSFLHIWPLPHTTMPFTTIYWRSSWDLSTSMLNLQCLPLRSLSNLPGYLPLCILRPLQSRQSLTSCFLFLCTKLLPFLKLCAFLCIHMQASLFAWLWYFSSSG